MCSCSRQVHPSASICVSQLRSLLPLKASEDDSDQTNFIFVKMDSRLIILSLIFFLVVTDEHVFAASDCYCMNGGPDLQDWHSMSDDCPMRTDCSLFLRFVSANGSNRFTVTAYGNVPQNSDRSYEVRLTGVDDDGGSPKVLMFNFTMNRLHREKVNDIEYKFAHSLVEQQNEKVMNVCEHTTNNFEIRASCYFILEFDIGKHPVLVQVIDYHHIHHHKNVNKAYHPVGTPVRMTTLQPFNRVARRKEPLFCSQTAQRP